MASSLTPHRFFSPGNFSGSSVTTVKGVTANPAGIGLLAEFLMLCVWGRDTGTKREYPNWGRALSFLDKISDEIEVVDKS